MDAGSVRHSHASKLERKIFRPLGLICFNDGEKETILALALVFIKKNK
jgi:hypothetical protein